MMDQDGDGRVDEKDLKAMLTNLGKLIISYEYEETELTRRPNTDGRPARGPPLVPTRRRGADGRGEGVRPQLHPVPCHDG